MFFKLVNSYSLCDALQFYACPIHREYSRGVLANIVYMLSIYVVRNFTFNGLCILSHAYSFADVR